MVVCEDGRMKKGEYRKFRIRDVSLDDFGAMKEVVGRRQSLVYIDDVQTTSSGLKACVAGEADFGVRIEAEGRYVVEGRNAAGEVLGTWVPTTDLEIAAASYERQVSELVEEDDETSDYVSRLETRHDESGGDDETAGKSLVAEVERYLRRRQD